MVIGIGGSYLGARAAIEFLTSPNYNLLSKKTPNIYFAGNSISAQTLPECVKQGFQRQRHFEIRHNHRTGRGFPCIP